MRFSPLLLVLVLMALFPLRGRAGGDEVGNGGNVAICADAQGQSTVELFDYFEAKILDPQIAFDLGPSTLDAKGKVAYVLARLEKVSPMRAANYRAFIDSIWKDGNFVESDLVPVDDSHNSVMPANCHLKQVALHLKPEFDPYHKKVLINRPLYEQLDEVGKAGLFLHEAIYDELISLGRNGDSSGVRYFNASLSAKADLSLKNFIPLLINAGLEEYEYHGFWFELYSDLLSEGPWDFDFFPSGGLREGHFRGLSARIGETALTGRDQVLRLKGGAEWAVSGEAAGVVLFREDGTVVSMSGVLVEFDLQNQKIDLVGAKLDADEVITQACVRTFDDAPVVLLGPNQSTIPLTMVPKTLTLNSSGEIVSAKDGESCD